MKLRNFKHSKETESNKLWIVTELFSPDQTSTAFILTEVAKFLNKSREVEVICGPSNYDQISGKGVSDSNSDLKITRLRSLNVNKNNLFFRSIKQLILSLQLSIKYLAKSKRGEHVLIVTNPVPILLVFALISKFTKRKINLLVHDVFPENTLPSKIISSHDSLIYWLLKKIFDHAYSQFDTLIVLGRDMKLVLNNKINFKKGKKTSIKIIENWADIDEVYPTQPNNIYFDQWGVSNKFIFLFAGNIGRNQALDELFDVIKNVTNPYLHFVFMGEGASKEKLIQFKTIEKLSNISITSSFPRSEQCSILNSCNVGLVTLAIGMKGLGVPSKSYNILAAGKPILFFGDENSEISLLINENKVGWSFNSAADLLNFFNTIDEDFVEISNQIGRKSRRVAEEQYSKSLILKKFEQFL